MSGSPSSSPSTSATPPHRPGSRGRPGRTRRPSLVPTRRPAVRFWQPGRPGRGAVGAVAVFLGGHQAGLAAAGNPVKANAVTILSLRSLAGEHQPGTDSGRCVTLHELAHAFHYHVVGDKNPIVLAAYKQAMERKLYDPALYAATNEHEYFAELSVAYLKKLDYFPRTRQDLKKH